MPNVNCLQYAMRGDNIGTVPANTWTQAGWANYLASPSQGQTSQNWSTLALAVRKLLMTTSGWKVPASNWQIKSAGALNTSGSDLVRFLSGNDGLNFTKRSGTTGPIPNANIVIVMGDFANSGGVHFFARVNGVWLGVPGPNDTVAQAVTVTGNASFTQAITGGQKSGTVLGWFA